MLTKWDGSTDQYLFIEKDIIGYLENITDNCWDIETLIQLNKMYDIHNDLISKIHNFNKFYVYIYSIDDELNELKKEAIDAGGPKESSSIA